MALAGLVAVGCSADDPQAVDDGGSGTDGTDATDATDGGDASTSTRGDDTVGETGETSDTGVDPPPFDTDVEWEPCSVVTGGQGSAASCATVGLPLDWSDPDGERIDVFVKRIGNPDGDKQLWMLMGGPGAPASGYESNAQEFTGADPQLVVYLPDHRGVGRSTRLGCATQEAPASPSGMTITTEEWPACIADLEQTWGDGLAQFTTSNASRDVGWLVDKLRGTQAVHVFGSSYGTYWGHRYLQIYPDQPDSLSLLGIAPPGFNFARFTEQYDDAGRRFMDACSADPVCSARLGPNAQGTMQQVMDAVDGGLCPGALAAGLTRDILKVYFGSRISWTWAERAVVPATIHRLQRCNAADVAALQVAAPQMLDPLAGLLNDPLFSRVINQHISISEMWFPPFPTVQEAQDAASSALFGLGSTEGRVVVAPQWPVYEHDEFVQTYAESDVPILMMVGEFDPNSPLELGIDFADRFTGDDQHFLIIPGGNHGWDSPTSQGYGCAINVFFNFIQDPQGPVLDCMGDVAPVDFAGSQALAQQMFGTSSLYD